MAGRTATLNDNITVPEPFKLTRPRPRGVVVPEPLPVETVPKARPIPESTYASPLEKQALERERQKNRKRAERTWVVVLLRSFGRPTQTFSSLNQRASHFIFACTVCE
jgi:hypothetical protein